MGRYLGRNGGTSGIRILGKVLRIAVWIGMVARWTGTEPSSVRLSDGVFAN